MCKLIWASVYIEYLIFILEHAVIFGPDIQTIEYLIKTYNDISESNNTQAKEKWADLALELGSDGFQKSLNSLKSMMEGNNKLFAEGSILDVIAGKQVRVSHIAKSHWIH